MVSDGRKANGTFAPGWKGGPGRPPRAAEANYVAAFRECVTVEDWHAVIHQALADAKGGDAKAREWLSSYLVGKPREIVETDEAPLESPKVILLDWRRNADAAAESN